MKRIVLLVLFTIVFIAAFGQWQSLYPKTTLHRYLSKAIILPGNSLYVAAGNNIASSLDFGASWNVTHSNSLPRQLSPAMLHTDLVFTDSETGYMVFRNQIFKTQDRGTNWENILSIDRSHPGYSTSANFNAIFFADPDIGYAVGDFDKIFKTTDGGESWDTLKWNNSTAPFRSYSDVFFLNADTGFVAGYEVHDILMNFGFEEFVMMTEDGGTTWTTYPLSTSGDYRTMKIQFINGQTGFIHTTRSQNHDNIWMSADSAKTWTPITPPDLSKATCMYWITPEIGLVFGKDVNQKPVFFRTGNRGLSWIKVNLPATGLITEHSIQDINFLDDTHGFAVGEGGAIFTTSNSGITWNEANRGHVQYHSFGFSDDDTGYASIGYGFYRTQDGGNSWDFAPLSDSLRIVSMGFAKNKSYFLGLLDRLYEVTSPTQLQPLTLPVSFFFAAPISIIHDQDSLYLAGYRVSTENSPPFTNSLIKSGDNGQTWETFEIVDGESRVVNVRYVDGLFFAATTTDILLSADRGETWESISVFSTDNLKDMVFMNSMHGIAVLVSNQLLYTNDQGNSWNPVNPLSTESHNIYGLLRVNDTMVFAYGSKTNTQGTYGAIWKSMDGGQTWADEALPVAVDNSITRMCLSENFIYATGGCGQILRMPIPYPITLVEAIETKTKIEIYPVPVTTQLHLRVHSTIKHLCSIEIYSSDGRLAHSLPMSKLGDQSSIDVSIDVSSLTKGLYVLKLHNKEGFYLARFIKL